MKTLRCTVVLLNVWSRAGFDEPLIEHYVLKAFSGPRIDTPRLARRRIQRFDTPYVLPGIPAKERI